MAIEWLVENLRVSLFSDGAVQVTEADWQNLTGQQMADNRQAVPGGLVFAGRYQEAQLSVAGAGNRADIIMTNPPTTEITEELRLPTFGPWLDVRNKFLALTKKWRLGARFPVTRIAFGAVLLGSAEDKVDAYGHLKRMLSSVNVNPQEMRDFIYRVNWPLTSNVVQELSINRITHWSALQFQMAQIPLEPAAVVRALNGKHAVRLEIDHNTDAARKEPFAADVIEKLYSELIGLASDNAAKGEKP